MIRKPVGVRQLHEDLIQRVEVTHRTCLSIVQALRDAGAEVWTVDATPSAAARKYSATGWVQHFTSERARLSGLRDTVAPIIQRLYPEMVTPIQDYLSDVPLIVADIQAAIDRHGGRNERLTAGERATLANAIEARVEA